MWLILNSCSLMRKDDAPKIYENRLFFLFNFQKVFSKSSILHGFLGIQSWRFAWISVSFVSIWRILVLEFQISYSYIIMIHRMFWKHRLKGNLHSKKVNFGTPNKQISSMNVKWFERAYHSSKVLRWSSLKFLYNRLAQNLHPDRT